MGKIKKGLIIFGIIFLCYIVVTTAAKVIVSSDEPEPKQTTTPTQQATELWKEKYTPEELREWKNAVTLQQDRDGTEWFEEIKQQRELEKEIIAWKEKMDKTFVADVDPKMSEEEWYYTKNCTEMSMAWGLMPDVLWIESEVKQAIKVCIEESGF